LKRLIKETGEKIKEEEKNLEGIPKDKENMLPIIMQKMTIQTLNM